MKKPEDIAYEKWGTRARVFFVFFPGILFFPFWAKMKSVLGPEGAGGILIMLQLVCLVYFPDRIGYWASNRIKKNDY